MTRSGWLTSALVGRGAAVALLARRHRRRPQVPGTGATRRAAGAALAVGVPAAVVHSACRRGARPTSPRSIAGNALLGGYVLAGAAVEELLWRAPLLSATRPAGRALLSGAGFAALHVARDGPRAAPVHLANTAAWTSAAVLGRSIMWTTMAHAAYNYAAFALAPPGPRP